MMPPETFNEVEKWRSVSALPHQARVQEIGLPAWHGTWYTLLFGKSDSLSQPSL